MKTFARDIQASLAALLLLFPAVLNAGVFTLSSGDSSAVIDPCGAGMESWLVDGQNQLCKQWFWYRIGRNGPERNISTLPLISASQPGAGLLDLKYGNSRLSIELTFSLLGGTAGSGEADIDEQIRIDNLKPGSMALHFFQYADFNLGGTSANDTVQLNSSHGLFNEAYQHEGNVDFADTVVTPGANRGEVAKGCQIYNQLNDGCPTTLNDCGGPITGNSSWALEWDPTLRAGHPFIVSIDKKVTITSVPEPAMAAVSVAGGIALIVRRRLAGS